MICVLGHQDIPIKQEQPDFRVDLLQTNILLFGSPMSGKSNLIRLLTLILHKLYRETDEQIFILDFGGALADLETLPLVSAYFDNANEEYVKRVFKLMEDQLKSNISALKGKNYASCTERQPIHTTLFIDNVNAFLDEPRYTAYQEKLAKLCRDGLSKGITVVMTASSTKGLGSYMNNFKQKIALEMPAESYMDIFSNKVIPVGNNPGHGYANVTLPAEDTVGALPAQVPYELQLNLADDCADERFQANLTRYFADRSVKKYRRFPEILTEAAAADFIDPADADLPDSIDVTVGLDYTECKPCRMHYESAGVIAIYGKKEFGKTNLLRRLLKNLLSNPQYRFVFFDDGREQLRSHLADEVCEEKRKVYFSEYATVPMKEKNGGIVNMKLSPLQQLVLYVHRHFIDLSKVRRVGNLVLNEIFGTGLQIEPGAPEDYNRNDNVVFVMQSKFLYVNSPAAKVYMEIILPNLAARAEEKNWIFIFSDIKNISDSEIREYFNYTIGTAFLLDNIAEFVNERGQKSVFGNMDTKSLKEEYASCELGDGYMYSVEKDELKKVKLIKEGDENDE